MDLNIKEYLMSENNIQQHEFGVRFKSLAENIMLAEIDTPLAAAKISLYGGHVVSWQPKTQAMPVLWISELARFQYGKAVRGGIPVCWPWFGKHPSNTNLPGHGYARIVNWDLVSIESLNTGEIIFSLLLGKSAIESQFWGRAVSLELKIVIGTTLEVALTTTNNSDQEISFTEGLHTYFRISNIDNIRILGLENCEYVDLVRDNELHTQQDVIKFNGELGRIFLNNKVMCTIEDLMFNRRIHINKINSNSTAVWNPGIDVASKMDDLGPTGWEDMVCVETANALSDKITLKPKKSHTQIAIYSVESII
jgi:glucose-6-phosphate 1-epimerase